MKLTINYFNSVIKKEENNLFNWSMFSFLLGLIISYLYVFSIHKYFFIISGLSIFVIIISIFCIVKKIMEKFILLIIFFIFGILILQFKIIYNKTTILNEDLKFAKIYGNIVNIESSTINKYQVIFLKNITIENIKLKEPISQLKVYTYSRANFDINDRIYFVANLNAPYDTFSPKGFNYKKQFLFQSISATGSVISKIKIINKSNIKEKHNFNFINDIRNYFINKINNNMSERVQGIASAVTLGGYSYITKSDIENITKAGLLPIISISGYHIGIITIFIFFFVRLFLALIPFISLRFDTKKISAIITIIILILYMCLLGDIPPALRSGVMAIIIMLGIIFNFQTISIRNLLLAIFILLICDPYYIASASFLLSFVATGAVIIFLNSKLAKYLYSLSLRSFFKRILFTIIISILGGIFVEISLFPIIIYYFNDFPTYSIFSNLIVTPIFSFLIMPFLFLGMFSGSFIAFIAFKISGFGIYIMLYISHIIANLKGSVLYFLPTSEIYFIYYLILFLIFISSKSNIKWIILFLGIYIYIIPFCRDYPDIMVDQKLKLVAFRYSGKYFFISSRGKKIIKESWIKNPVLTSNIVIKKLKSENISCDKQSNCVIHIKNKIISYLKNYNDLLDGCLNSDITIFSGDANIKCKKTFIIDKKFLKKYGTTFIYINKNDRITIRSNKDTFYVQ